MLCSKLKVFICGLSIFFTGVAFAGELPKIKASMLMEHEGFLMWYAKKQGWDHQLGFDLEVEITGYNSKVLMSEKINDPYAWQVSACSSVSYILSPKDLELDMIAIACDEAAADSVMVKKDSDILKHKGYVEEFPHVYGSPESIKGKKFGVKGVSSGLYTLSRWLDLFELNLSDIELHFIKESNIIDSAKNNGYDGLALWSPDSFDAIKDGFVPAATATELNEEINIMLIADSSFARENPDLVSKMLAVYCKAVDVQRNNPHELVDDYKEFYRTFGKVDYPDEILLEDLMRHKIYGIDSQLKLFSTEGNKKSDVQKFERYATTNVFMMFRMIDNSGFRISNRIKSQRYVNGSYLPKAKEYLRQIK